MGVSYYMDGIMECTILFIAFAVYDSNLLCSSLGLEKSNNQHLAYKNTNTKFYLLNFHIKTLKKNWRLKQL